MPGPDGTGPGDSYKEGGDCVIEWGLDSTGTWTNMQIELKTGDNLAMVPLQGAQFSPSERITAQHAHENFVAITTIDATKETRYVYPCPAVCPPAQSTYY